MGTWDESRKYRKNKDKDIYPADLNRLFKEKGFVLFLD